ncbi:heme oxygenase 2 [Drosophila serrata]|uniref:heme oxygenase 2 n=1 Tax=Drosophila serrata TaxID=7274 RepID=UPI000A1D1054|nr:heme oxygenase 2 [Drosophila serrata]XP_020811822.1 heme oxygenase 2 [Drosophila serrata]
MSSAEETTKAAENVEDVEFVDMAFTQELRKATKDVHKLTDAVVNAKFAFALSDDEVWYDGLLAFYELYKFFETHLPERLLPMEFYRTAAFERDFAYFYGADWKETYEIRPAVQKYLEHLEKVAAQNELLLFAYAYQMYMALMSGGQMLQKKRMIARKLWIFSKRDDEELQKHAEKEAELATARAADAAVNQEDLQARPMPEQVTICPRGCEATYFPEKISVLKAKLRRVFNSHYGAFDDELRAAFIEESRNVFRFNIEVVRTIKGVNRANLRKLALAAIFVTSIVLAIKLAIK